MSVRRFEAVVVRCDEQPCDVWADSAGPAWESEQQARGQLTGIGWSFELGPGGVERHLCPIHRCERDGHVPDETFDDRCARCAGSAVPA